jgi:CO/xanthine dehydrogenase Mo-binding subunit
MVGKNVRRRDIPKKMTGGAAYVQDVRLPGMVFGRIVRPPSPVYGPLHLAILPAQHHRTMAGRHAQEECALPFGLRV